eukprot:CAMPEP_0201594994 /NCGR_PEP_ID=MMETSP0190_2-20130828/192139_1 /ASSEMBLY_ACC=CAM_ASM_000263 /TAXON_ID=37353 /ORGANISM="Rosalina sp." /LENGTH=221 /DNA_ID=CAMNT_0048054819 /DNA_START=63 /DNA_END=727 /DNA_ORIENTATION=+
MVTVDVEPHKTWRLAAHIDTAGQSFTILSFTHSDDEDSKIPDIEEKLDEMLRESILATGGQSESPVIKLEEVEEHTVIDEKMFGGILLGVLMFVTTVCNHFGFQLSSDIAAFIVGSSTLRSSPDDADSKNAEEKSVEILSEDTPATDGPSESPVVKLEVIDEKMFGGILLVVLMFVTTVCNHFGFQLSSDIAAFIVGIVFCGMMYAEKSRNMDIIPKKDII